MSGEHPSEVQQSDWVENMSLIKRPAILRQGQAIALAFAAAALAAAIIALPAVAYAEAVGDARMKAAGADAANWILHGRDYANQRFSPLDAINTGNVKKLVPKFIYQTGIAGTFQTTPLVVDGTMYLTTAFSNVVAIDAKTGFEKWRYEHKRTSEKLCCGPGNRGASIGYGKIYVATVDAHLIALDQATGKKVWDVKLVEPLASTEDKTSMKSEIPWPRKPSPARPASAPSRRRWSTTAWCSSASPASATGCIWKTPPRRAS